MTGSAMPQVGILAGVRPIAPGHPGTKLAPCGRPIGGNPRRRFVAVPHSGFTLLEMLIVLAILAVLASTAYPALRGSLEKSRLHEAAKQVRIELARARVAAIEWGVIWQFRFQEGGSVFELSRSLPPDENLQLAWDDGQTMTTFGEQTLPEGITFAPLETPEATQAAPLQDGVPVAQQWSSPLFFYPNGRSSNVRIRLSGSQGRFIDLTLRGMTGTAKVGRLQQEAAP